MITRPTIDFDVCAARHKKENGHREYQICAISLINSTARYRHLVRYRLLRGATPTVVKAFRPMHSICRVGHVQILWLLPIKEQERAFKVEHGLEAAR